MSPFLIFLVAIGIVSTTHGCGKVPQVGVSVTQDGRSCGQNCWNGRRKRAAAPAKIQDVLLEFDIRLTEELANEIKDLTEAEKEQFIQDLEKMNNAVKLEAPAVSDDSVQNSEEFLAAISDRIAQDFQGKKWFNRLRSIAGEKITKLINEMSQRN